MSLCSICLRTNLAVNTVGNSLISFYDNLLDHKMFSNLSVCVYCEHFLDKCHDFKQLCQKSNKVLQDFKKKKKPENSTVNLHFFVQQYYKKVFQRNDEKEIRTILENNDIMKKPNIDNSISENDAVCLLIKNECTEIEKNYNNSLQNNHLLIDIDILKKSIEMSQLNSLTEPYEETGLNLSDNEHIRIGDNSDNECNRIGDNNDNECNRIGDNSDNECNDIENNSDIESNGIDNNSGIKNNRNEDDIDTDCETDDGSSGGMELINNLLENAKKKSKEITKKQKKTYSSSQQGDDEDYTSVFDILIYKSKEEAKAELMQRPYSDYYKNAAVKCTICYTVFKSQKTLDYHMRWHDRSAGDHVCDICKMRYKTHRSVMNHKYHSHYGRYSCKKCPLVTSHKGTMMGHYKIHQGISYKCKYCDTTYRHHQNYLAHLRNLHPSIYYQTKNVCTLCGHSFTSPNGLKMHKAKVHQLTEVMETESSVKCEECDLTFVNQQAYMAHVMNAPCHKLIASTIIACVVCGKQFDDKLSLSEHKRQEHHFGKYVGGKTNKNVKKKIEVSCKVICEECGATGINRSWLYNHCRNEHPNVPYNAHDVERQYLCDQCGKSFRLRCKLEEHQRVHTGARPLACGECGATFRTKLALHYHTQTHRPRSRVCTRCGKKFVSAANLFNHMRIHIGDRRYKCICGKGFLHTWALQEHVRGVHLKVRRVKKQKRRAEQTQKD